MDATHCVIGGRRIPRVGPLAVGLALVLSLLYLATSAQPALALTFVVNQTTDTNDGTCDSNCTLREAINAANANAGADTITFFGSTFPSSLPGTITLTSTLPTMTGTGADVINATDRGVNIDGVSDSFTCFDISGSNKTIVGIDLVTNCDRGFNIYGSGNTIGGNNLAESGGACSGISDDDTDGYVNDGCPQVGATAESGTQCNAAVNDDSGDDSVANDGCPPRGQGIVISGHSFYGLDIQQAGGTSNNVLGNYIGTDSAGAAALANGNFGILLRVNANNTTIGGSAPGERNIISGNLNEGIRIGTSGNTVRGNYIGTNAAGTAALGNPDYGVHIITTQSNTIGGATSGERNVISGNGSGVRITSSGANNNSVAGNFIGTNAAGTAAIGNSLWGVIVDFSPIGNTIGGNNASESNCSGPSDDDSDGYPNDGCPQVSANAEQGANCANVTDDDSDGVINDGCPPRGSGNVISGSGQDGVLINSAGASNVVTGNYIGTDVHGTADLGNGFSGIETLNTASLTVGGSTVGERNIISGNNTNGIRITGASSTGNAVKGNYIGTNAAGNADLGNTSYGARIDTGATNNTVGGTTAGSGNVISGNNANGVIILGATSNGNIIQGNYVGTNAAGTAAVGNSFRGIEIEAPTNAVGGSVVGARNVVSGNGDKGIGIEGSGVTGVFVQGNYVGVGADGTTAIANTNQGIWIASSANGQTIGGTAAGAGNLIASNGAHGIGILTTGNGVYGNTIRNNGIDGIYVDANANFVGGIASGAGNVITANGGDGVFINSGVGTSMRGNSIYANTGLGIDLSPNGVTSNDAGDGDTGPNDLLNFPVITSASFDGTQTTISGTLDTPNPQTKTVDVYSSDAVDPTGNGEGRVYLGSATPNVGGAWTLIFSGAQPYTRLTATTTDETLAPSTSEFSAAFTPALGAGMPLTAIARQGQATPVGGTFNNLGFAQVPSGSGTVVFWASVTGGTAAEGIFSGSGGAITKLVAAGDPAPIASAFATFGTVPVVNDSNDIVFWATTTAPTTQGIFRRTSGGVITKLVAVGDAAPGGGTFTTFQAAFGPPVPVANNLGDVSFWANRSVGGEGVFLYSSGSVSKVAGVGDSAPGGGMFADFGGSGFATIAIVTDNRQVTFRASLTGGGPVAGIYLLDGASLTRVVATGDTTPLGGTYAGFGRAPVPNESGQVGFFATMTGSSAGACSCAVFRKSGGTTTKLLAGGDPGPIGVGGTINDIATGPIMNDSGQVTVWVGIANGLASESIVRITNPVANVAALGNSTPNGGTFSSFISGGFPATSIVNNQGQVAFWGAYVGGTGTAGIFLTTAPTPGQPTITQGPVAGAAAPGTNGGTFGNNFDLDINGSGRAVFADTVNGGSSGAGVFMFFAGSAVQDISLQGEAAPGGGTYSTFSPPVNNDGNTIVGRATTSGGQGEGLYLFFAGAAADQAVALKNDGLPSGTPGGGTYNGFGDPQINNAGQIAANANINGNANATQGLFLFFAGQPVTSAKTQALAKMSGGDPAPGGGTFLFFAGSPSITNDGRIVQKATLNPSGEGLYMFFAGQPVSTAQKIAKTNSDPVPGGGTFLFFAGSPAVSSDGRVVAVADYSNGGPKTGLFLFFAGSPSECTAAGGSTVSAGWCGQKLADLDTNAPTGGKFNGFANPVLTDGLNPEVVARGTTTLGKEGLFLFFAGSPVKTVVKQDDPVPSGVGTFSSSPPVFPFHAMNNAVQVVFVGNIAGNPATSQGVFIASLDGDSDGIIDFNDNCPTLTNTDQRNTDASLAAAGANVVGDALGNACDSDDDNDAFADTVETATGTNPLDNCVGGPGTGGDPWPADITGDHFSDISDVVFLTNVFGQSVPPAPARYNIGDPPPDGYIDISDVVKMVGLFGMNCAP